MSVSFQPQVWGDKIFSPITSAIQQERQRQHQKDLADASNNLRQQQIDMQKNALDRAISIEEQNSDINKQLYKRQLDMSENKRNKENYQTSMANKGTFTGWRDRWDYERRFDDPNASKWNPINLLGMVKDAFDATQFMGKEDYAKDAANSLKWGDAPSPLKINEGVPLTDSLLNKLLSNLRLEDMTIDQKIEALKKGIVK